MATRYWIGTAPAVKQLDTLTVGGTIETDDRFIVTLTGEDGETEVLNVEAGSTVAADVATTIQAAASALTTPLFAAITWSTNGADILAEAKTAGVPFYCATSTTEDGGGAADDQTFTRAATVANSGPCDWHTAANWSDETKPVTGDTVYIENCATDILYGLNQSAVTLAALHVRQNFLGKLGQAGAYLRIGATIVNIGEHYGSTTPAGSPRIKLDLGTTQTAIFIYNSARYAAEANLPPVRLLADHNNTALYLQRGHVGLCCENPTETSRFDRIVLSSIDNQRSDANLVCGPGLTLNELLQNGGTCALQSAATTIEIRAGTLTIAGTGAIGTLVVRGGIVYSQTTGTIALLYLYGGTLDFDRCTATRTVSILYFSCEAPGRIKDTLGRVSFTAVTFAPPLNLSW